MPHRALPPLLTSAVLVVTASCSSGSGSGTPSDSAVSATAPGAPTIGMATAGNGQAEISFTAPSSNGGSTITMYTASCEGGGSAQTGEGASGPITVAGLTNGTTYSCSVTATNAVGTSVASGTISVTPEAGVSTAAIDCPYSCTFTGSYSSAGTLTAEWSWTCGGVTRTLNGNGLPDHAVGTFPNSGNPNTISEQIVSTSMPLEPRLGTSTTQIGGPTGVNVYARNSVKFDPATAGTCPGTATQASDCNLAQGNDSWRIEALGQDVFDFGEDMNNAHVQPTGEYHYHGMPEGILSNAGVSDTDRAMVLIGWAADGFPVYGRYCYSDAMDANSEVKVCEGSYELDSVPDAGRPDTSWVPLGAFGSDWSYTEGLGDLDDCNGREGVTPEFPDGIYYYMATDTYPYFGRCLKGQL